MPVENEFRYVLFDSEDVLWNRLVGMPDVVVLRIEQADLSVGTRLRLTECPATGVVLRQLAFKRAIDGDKIEIETELDEDDFDRLWSTSHNRHDKTRFSLVVSRFEFAAHCHRS